MTSTPDPRTPSTARKALIDRLDEGGYEWEEVHALIDAIEADLLAQIEKAALVLDQSGGDRYAIEARGILRAAIRSAAPVEPT